MSLLNYTYTSFPDNTVAVGSQVMTNFDEAKVVVNGQLNDDNLANNGITASTKIIDGTIDAAAMGTDSVREVAMDYASANAGALVVRAGPNYAGAGGLKIIRVEKTIAIAGATTTLQSYTVDWSASDAVDGAVTFSGTPTIVGIELEDADTPAVITSAAIEAQRFVTEITTTGCKVNLRFSTTATAGNLVLHLVAVGPVA